MTTKGRKSKNSVRAACDLAREQEAIDQSATRAQASPSGSVSDASMEVCSDSDDAEGELANQATPAAAGTVNTKDGISGVLFCFRLVDTAFAGQGVSFPEVL